MADGPRTVPGLCRAHARVAVDSNVFIYLFEGTGPHADRAAELADAIGEGTVAGCLATLGLAEILTGPARFAATEIADRYVEELTSFENLALVPLDVDVARDAAAIRGESQLSLGDAIHLASARRFGATVFVTNDRRIRPIDGVTVAYLDELVPAD
jgi:predicted nucleic acid-binding protein